MILWWLLVTVSWGPAYGENNKPALRFVMEPPYRVDFYNSNGTVIPCSASGEPLPITVNWETHDGARVTNITGLRSVRPDGTLVFPPFIAKDYRQDIHATTYRCVLSNSVGKIASRDIHVLAVVHQDYDVQVVNGYSIQSNIAVLRCNIPSFVKDYVTVTSWKRGDNLKITSDFETGGRYLVFPTGELHIQNACAKDGFTTYSCITRNSMKGEVKSSKSFGKLVVSDDNTNRPPRINHSQTRVGIKIGQDVILPCAAQGFPPPTYMQWYSLCRDGLDDIIIGLSMAQRYIYRLPVLETEFCRYASGRDRSQIPEWYRYTDEIYPKMVPVVLGIRVVKIGGSLLLRKVTPEDSGTYTCLVKNKNGQDKTEVNLIVRENLRVSVVPVVHTVDVGKSAVFQCNVSGQPVTFLTWKKDLEHLTHVNRRVHFVSETVLEIRQVRRQDKGLYQCFVCNDKDCAQGTAELKLGDIAPTLKESFRSVTLEPGSMLSLKCIAFGNPLPEVRWTLDGYPIPGHVRFSVGDFVTSKAEVVSYVNVTHVRVEDGGYYKCQATNDVGSVFNREKINVIGPPFVRLMKNTTAVEGRTFYTRCPASGYPVEEISWEHNGRRIPYNHRQRAFSNGSLIIRNVDQRSDEGEYSCTARNQKGQRGHGKMFVDVLIPPNIEPFTIPTGLEDGSRSRILCSVTKGDTPIQISWLKNGKAIPPHLGIIESAIDEFSTFLTFPQLQLKHGGNYTCVAQNIAASTNYTARMVIYAPPRWINEPRDTSAILNSDVIIDCQADGFPKPGITWRKSKGSVSSDYVSLRTNAHINVVTNGSLAIRKVEKDDAGFYMCQAINGIGPGISAVVKLRIKVPAYFVNKFKAETIRKSHLLQITCQIFGDHPLTVQWKKDGENLDFRFDRRYDITQSLTNDGMISQLQVLSADRRDSSLFTCLGSNNFGSDEMNIQIIVQEPPDRPSNIRVEQVGSRKITLFWSAPYSGNSPITRFILIYRSEGDHDHQNRKEMIIPASHTNVVVKNLLPATEYHFHLLAENAVGRSDLSEEITVTSDIEVPGGPPQDVRAEVLGSQLVRVTWKSPEPHLTHGPIKGYYVGYKVHGSSEAHTYKTMNANVKDEKLTCFLKNLKKLTRYKIIVQAFNIKGAGPPSDEVLFVTLDNDPPTAPKLKMASVSFTSIQVTWTVQGSDNIPISGFILNHKRDTENWIKTRLPNDSRMYTFYGLHCGTPYQFFIIAFNDIGESFPSNTVQVKTRGAAPSSPTQHAFISVNVTSATLHFMEWDSGGCPVSYFVIQYKAEVSKDWIVVNERIFPQTLTYVIGGLIPATWYQLRVVAHNDAGSTRADYSFVTLPLSSQTSSTARSNSLHLYTNLVIIIPVIVSCIILAVVVVIVCSVTRRRQGRRDTRAVQKELTTESVPMSEVESKPTTDCVYSRPKSCLNYPSPYASNCIPFDHRHNLRSEDSRIERHSTVDSKRIYDVPFAMREPAHSSGLDYRERRNTPVHETSRKHSHDSNNATYSFPAGRPTSQPMLRNYTTHLSHSWCNSDMDDNLTVNLPYEKTSFATRWHGSSKQGADIAQFYWNGYTSNPEIEDGYSYSTRIPDLTFHENDDEAEFDRDQVLDSCPGFLNKWGTPFHVAFSRQVLLYPIETDI